MIPKPVTAQALALRHPVRPRSTRISRRRNLAAKPIPSSLRTDLGATYNHHYGRGRSIHVSVGGSTCEVIVFIVSQRWTGCSSVAQGIEDRAELRSHLRARHGSRVVGSV